MSNEVETKPTTCPKCGGAMKNVSFRTGSTQLPKRQEQCCSACGNRCAAEPTTPEPTET